MISAAGQPWAPRGSADRTGPGLPRTSGCALGHLPADVCSAAARPQALHSCTVLIHTVCECEALGAHTHLWVASCAYREWIWEAQDC